MVCAIRIRYMPIGDNLRVLNGYVFLAGNTSIQVFLF